MMQNHFESIALQIKLLVIIEAVGKQIYYKDAFR